MNIHRTSIDPSVQAQLEARLGSRLAAAQVVTRTRDAIFPVLNYLTREVFPFNYVIPGESTNTIFNFRSYCASEPHLSKLLPKFQLSPDLEDEDELNVDNRFSAPDYRVVHFVVDLPVRLPENVIRDWPGVVREYGKVVFVQTEFQVIDRETEQANELGDASHQAYKDRQKLAVIRRLKVGLEEKQQRRTLSALPPPPQLRPARPGRSGAARARSGAQRVRAAGDHRLAVQAHRLVGSQRTGALRPIARLCRATRPVRRAPAAG